MQQPLLYVLHARRRHIFLALLAQQQNGLHQVGLGAVGAVAQDLAVIVGVAPGEVVHVFVGVGDDVVDFALPAVLVHHRRVDHVVRRVDVDPAILCVRVHL